jgi:hypothetical protein
MSGKKPKRILSEKQKENLARGREKMFNNMLARHNASQQQSQSQPTETPKNLKLINRFNYFFIFF